MYFVFMDISEDLSTLHQFLWMFQGNLKIGACLGYSREVIGEVSEFSELK